MNLFFRIKDKLITSPISDSILDGITRKSIIELAKSFKIDVEERPITIDELLSSFENGDLKEIFGTGTAVVVLPIECFGYQNKDYTIPYIENSFSIQLKKKLNVVTLESHRAESEDFYLSEIEFVKAIVQAIDKELAIPSLFLLYKELIPIINVDFIDEKDSEAKVKEDLNLELLSLFVTCGMKVNECKQLFHVIAGVLGQAVASVKMENGGKGV